VFGKEHTSNPFLATVIPGSADRLYLVYGRKPYGTSEDSRFKKG
jgi:hypothetical protein